MDNQHDHGGEEAREEGASKVSPVRRGGKKSMETASPVRICFALFLVYCKMQYIYQSEVLKQIICCESSQILMNF